MSTLTHVTLSLQYVYVYRLCLIKIAANLFIPPEHSAAASSSRSSVIFPWYHGPISRKRAEQILLTKSPTVGDFLVRLSESQVGKFTIVYVSNNRTLKNVLVHNYFESGYGLESNRDNCSEGHTFEKLPGKNRAFV